MSYNLILDSLIKENKHWEYINCKYENGYLISNNKVFGIKQTLILPDITKLYFRWTYNIEDSNIDKVTIGIQNKNTLNINERNPKKNKEEKISVIEKTKQEKIVIHLIFESTEIKNKVKIKEPLLCDLIRQNKSTWLKYSLDKKLYYMNGYNYFNEYSNSELKENIKDFKDIKEIESAKIGSIINTVNKIEIPLTANFIEGNYYLVKLDFKEINKFGNIFLQYKSLKSVPINEEQLYIIIKANKENILKLTIEANDIISYKINLKHLLITNISKLNLVKEDIPYLPFI